VYTKGDAVYQSETGLSTDGTELFRSEHPVEWIIGAGDNGFGTILRKDDFLFQAPLSFYAKPASWAPSPGYEYADVGFNRPILPGCIFCHSGRPNAIPDGSGKFESTPFAELAIGCEKCHGPGAAHIQSMSAGASTAKQKGASKKLESRIVNPARLTPYLSDNICMACHQTGDVRVLKPGNTFQDVRPGKPLDEWLTILMVPPTRAEPPTEDHVEHYYSMSLSKCYRASEGKMSCITCHDPHVQPSREEAPAYFAAKCMTCHTNQSCKLNIEARMQTKPANNCIGCHMPKRDIPTISHSSATNHRIVARPGEPFPDVTFQQTTAALPDLIRINPPTQNTQTQLDNPLPLLTLLQAYGELSESRPTYAEAYLKVLGQLEKTQPDQPLVQAALGHRSMKTGDFQAAVDHYRRSLELGPPVETTYIGLAEALTHLGQMEAALPLIDKAIALNPFNPVTRKMIIVQLIQSKQYARAREALTSYTQVFPQDDFMRQMLARVSGTTPTK